MNDQPTIDAIWDAGHLRPESISARLDGELIEGADAHLSSCDRCHSRLSEFRAISERVGAFPYPPANTLDLLTARALEEMVGDAALTNVPEPVSSAGLVTVTDLAIRRTQRSKRFMAMVAVAAVAVIGIGVGSVVRATRPVAPSDQLAVGDTTPRLRFAEPSTISPTPPGAVAQGTGQPAQSSAGTSPPAADAGAPAPEPPLSATELAARDSAALPTGAPPPVAAATKPTAPSTKQLDAIPPPSEAVGSGALSKAPAATGAVVTPTLPVLGATSPEALQVLLAANPALVDSLVSAGPCLSELTAALGGTEVRLGAAQINTHYAIIGVTRSLDKKAVPLRIAQADPISCVVTEIGTPSKGPEVTNAK